MSGIYFHIPFCKSKCYYCDFYSTNELSQTDRMVNAFCTEMSLRFSYLDDHDLLETIYFGGGTPSLLKKNHFKMIFETLNQHFNLQTVSELTLEANPEDITDDFLSMVKSFHFNRLSIGIQSFNELELSLLNRRHTAQAACDAVDRAKKYFSNISIDLMFGLPQQTLQSWSETLKKAIQMGVQHISAYQLTIEKGTVLYRQIQQGKTRPASDEMSTNMYYMLVYTLKKAGFDQYEISNFALPSFHSRHNSSYWEGKHYLGIGPSAHSFNGLSRQWNVANHRLYMKGIENSHPNFEMEWLSEKEHFNEYVITSLRTAHGIDLETLTERFGIAAKEELLQKTEKYAESGWISTTQTHIKLTTKGFWFSDGIMVDLMID
ncbi:MAG: radical SAM family heme chaperone HemW [Microbacter sp.]